MEDDRRLPRDLQQHGWVDPVIGRHVPTVAMCELTLAGIVMAPRTDFATNAAGGRVELGTVCQRADRVVRETLVQDHEAPACRAPRRSPATPRDRVNLRAVAADVPGAELTAQMLPLRPKLGATQPKARTISPGGAPWRMVLD